MKSVQNKKVVVESNQNTEKKKQWKAILNNPKQQKVLEVNASHQNDTTNAMLFVSKMHF